jgi:biopolymer transport protein ExbB
MGNKSSGDDPGHLTGKQNVMGRVTVNKGNGMTIARTTATVGLFFGVAMMAGVAMAQTAAPAGGAAPAAPAAPAEEAAPPAIGPDGLPVAPAAEAPAEAPAAAAPAAEAEKQVEITPYKMFMEATIVVQGVMVMLMLWSVVTWSILISKLTFFSGLNGKSNRVLQIFRSAGSIADAAKNAKSYRDNPLARMLTAAADEIATGKKNGLAGRVQARMSIVQSEAGDSLSSGMGIFATVGSISAFVGLFGTVWGIMNSFIGIAQSQTTNLAVVAPGIAEALFATAIGLFAAIPAVIFYNMFARRIGAYSTRMENFASEILVKIARDE